jgi:hypothetical protein
MGGLKGFGTPQSTWDYLLARLFCSRAQTSLESRLLIFVIDPSTKRNDSVERGETGWTPAWPVDMRGGTNGQRMDGL